MLPASTTIHLSLIHISWKLPDLANYPAINPPYVTPEMKDNYTPYKRNTETGVRYWALPGQEGDVYKRQLQGFPRT